MLSYHLIPLKRLTGLTNNSKKHSTTHTKASILQHGFRDPIQVDLVFNDDRPFDELLADKTVKFTLVEGHDRALNCLKALFKTDKANPPPGVEYDGKDWLIPATVTRSDSEAEAIAYSIDHNATTVAALGEGAILELFDSDLLSNQSSYLLEQNYNDLAVFDDLSILVSQDSSNKDLDANESDNGLADRQDDNDQNDQDDNDQNNLDNLTITPRAKTGDIWCIGPHRIIVGDCLDSATWARLLGDQKANIIFTSPPYASQRKYDEASGFEPIPAGRYLAWYKNVQDNIKLWLHNTGSYFLNIKEHCESGQRHLYVKKLTINHVEAWDWCFIDEFVWVRNAAPGRWPNRFKNGFEPVFHFTKHEKAIERFYPERVGHESDYCFNGEGEARIDGGNGTHWNMPVLGGDDLVSGVALPSNVVEVHTVNKNHGHQAAFPHKLPEWFIKAFSDEGDLVLDPFLGSGSTIVAAAGINRVGYGIELSPAYADIAIARIESLLSVTAYKLT